MIERIAAWIDGFTAASRFFSLNTQEAVPDGLLSSTAVSGWAAVGAALLSALAAWKAADAARSANAASLEQAISTRRLEILRLTSENISELLIARDKFTAEIQKIKASLNADDEIAAAVRGKLDKLLEETVTPLNTMVTANNAVVEGVFALDAGQVLEWDNIVRAALRKKQEISHTKSMIDIKIRQLTDNAHRLHPQ